MGTCNSPTIRTPAGPENYFCNYFYSYSVSNHNATNGSANKLFLCEGAMMAAI